MSRFKQNKIIQVLGQDVEVKPMSFETFGKITNIQKQFKGTLESEMDIKFVELSELVKDVLLTSTNITEEELVDIGALDQMKVIGGLADTAEKESQKKIETPNI
jgi:hypothetical protein